MTGRMLKQLAYLALCEAQATNDRVQAEYFGNMQEQLDRDARKAGWVGDYGPAFDPCHIAGQEPWSELPANSNAKNPPLSAAKI